MAVVQEEIITAIFHMGLMVALVAVRLVPNLLVQVTLVLEFLVKVKTAELLGRAVNGLVLVAAAQVRQVATEGQTV